MADKYELIGGTLVRFIDLTGNGGPYAMAVALASRNAGDSTVKTNAGYAANGQSIKTYTFKQALSATVPTSIALETVPTGKTFVITDIYLTIDTAALVSDVQIQAGGTPIFRGVVKGDTSPIQMPGLESQPTAAAGQLVQVVFPLVAGAPNGFGYIAGFEQ